MVGMGQCHVGCKGDTKAGRLGQRQGFRNGEWPSWPSTASRFEPTLHGLAWPTLRDARSSGQGEVRALGLHGQRRLLPPPVRRRFPRTFIIYTHTHKHICRRCRPLVRHTTIHRLTALSTALPFQKKSLHLSPFRLLVPPREWHD